jgi:hypothetical protein
VRQPYFSERLHAIGEESGCHAEESMGFHGKTAEHPYALDTSVWKSAPERSEHECSGSYFVFSLA